MTRFAKLPIVVALILTQKSWAAAPMRDDPGQHPAVQLFLNACASSYAHLEQVASETAKVGLKELSSSEAGSYSYLVGTSGRAWRGNVGNDSYVVALAPERLCCVVVHQGDAKAIFSGLESWLPPKDSGVSIKKRVSAVRDGTTTTSYQLYGGEVHEQWVITTSSNPASPIRAIISWNRLPAA